MSHSLSFARRPLPPFEKVGAATSEAYQWLAAQFAALIWNTETRWQSNNAIATMTESGRWRGIKYHTVLVPERGSSNPRDRVCRAAHSGHEIRRTWLAGAHLYLGGLRKRIFWWAEKF